MIAAGGTKGVVVKLPRRLSTKFGGESQELNLHTFSVNCFLGI